MVWKVMEGSKLTVIIAQRLDRISIIDIEATDTVLKGKKVSATISVNLKLIT